ncbi:MAG: O-antigen ligase family protein [Gaiellales bacterium]
MTSIALPRARAIEYRTPAVDFLFLATVATVTMAKIQWEVAGTLSFSDVITAAFLAAFGWSRLERGDGRVPRAAAITGAFFAAFLLVYLVGFFNLETSQALGQWAKGMFKFVLHFLFLIAGIVLLAQRGQRFYWITLAAFSGGLALNGLYGLLQLAYAETTGGNFDELFVQPITGGDSQINIYGAIEGQNVFRVNALTGDPNHLGIELSVPILILIPLYLRMERSNPWRRRVLLLVAFLAVVQLATLSRSGILGLLCGLLVLAVPYRRLLVSARFLVPLGLLSLGVLAFAAQRSAFFEQVIRSRFATEGKGTSTHIVVYDFIPDVLSTNPLFGLGLNNFSVYYEFVTGRTNFGPHSFYVALFVESGIVGAALFAVFLGYLFRRTGETRRLGRRLAALGDPLAIRVRPLGWGLMAALVATMVSNVFYLTMTFYYFFVVALLVIVPPVVFNDRR